MTSPEDHAFEILVVEDDDLVMSVIERTLRLAGYKVLPVVGGEEALAALDLRGPGLRTMYLDLTLPTLSGEEVLTRTRARFPSLPIVLSSGFDARAIRAVTLAAATVFLPKPFRANELLEAVQRANGGAAPAR